MPSLGAGEALALPIGLCTAFGPLVLWIGLIGWSRAVGSRYPETSRWRRLWVVPVASLGVQLLGIAITVVMLMRSFGTIAGTTAADRATTLAESISDAMNATACGLVLGAVLLVASIVLVVVGQVNAPRP
jgi:hypothetical protein